MGWRKSASAGYSIQGARENQEDHHGQQHFDHYALGFMCDGHNGPRCSRALGDAFQEQMIPVLSELAPRADVETVVQLMRECYIIVVEKAGRVGGGTTFSAYVVQYVTGLVIALQLGDSKIGIGNAESGELITSTPVYWCDDAVGDAAKAAQLRPGFGNCVVRTHTFAEEWEVERYARVLKEKHGKEIRVAPNRSADKRENRMETKVGPVGAANAIVPMWVDLPEPSRAIEFMLEFSKLGKVINDDLLALERPAEFTVWQLPDGVSCFVFAVCDGYDSKLAIPSDERLSRVIFAPHQYLQTDFLLDTCTSVYAPGNCGTDARSKIEFIKNSIFAQLDARWSTAYTESYDYVMHVLDSADRPSLLSDPLAAITLASHICVVLLSDDNVSTEVLILVPDGLSVHDVVSPPGSPAFATFTGMTAQLQRQATNGSIEDEPMELSEPQGAAAEMSPGLTVPRGGGVVREVTAPPDYTMRRMNTLPSWNATSMEEDEKDADPTRAVSFGPVPTRPSHTEMSIKKGDRSKSFVR